MNTELRKKVKNDFEKNFYNLMNNAVFGKTIENVRNHRDLRLVKTNKKRNKLVSESNYHTTKCFSENFLAIEMTKTKVKMDKPIYLGFSILDLSKIVMHEFWYERTKWLWVRVPLQSLNLQIWRLLRARSSLTFK